MARPLNNYWTPRRVIQTLTWYPEIASAVESGFAEIGGDDAIVSSRWEPGGAMEKLVCRKADIDLQVAKLKRPLQLAIGLYYLEGHESYRTVGRLLGISDSTARQRIQLGVRLIATWLCGHRFWGEKAVEIIRDGWRAKNKSRISSAQTPLRIVNERDLRIEGSG